MVDVGAKPETVRRAVAQARVTLGAKVFGLVRANRIAKGDVLAVAQIAGIQAGKRTAEWIPLCHTIPLDLLKVTPRLDRKTLSAVIEAEARTRAATGVEMEAMVAAAAAALALYDMVKGVDRGVRIEAVELLAKSGGASGTWTRR
jgi:molybdenum cofactor biosynthesis protein MoaC